MVLGGAIICGFTGRTGCTCKRSIERLTGAALNRGDVFANQLLDPLLQISMARGVSHAARFARAIPGPQLTP
jgi:hypothetical protein